MFLRINKLIIILIFFILPFGYSCAQQQSRICNEVEINSAGVYCLDPNRLLGVAPGSGGLNSIANYVRISPPEQTNENFNDIVKIILMADVRSSAEPSCQASNNAATIRCSVSLSGRMLKAIVTFRSPTPNTSELNKFEDRTKSIAADILDNVIIK